MPVAAEDLLPVPVCNDLCHRERHPDAAVERFGRKQNPVFQPPEAQRIFQILVDIEQIAVIDDQVQLVARRMVGNEAADRLKALAVCRDAACKLMIDRIHHGEEKALGIGIALPVTGVAFCPMRKNHCGR